MKLIITILMILFITNNIQSQTIANNQSAPKTTMDKDTIMLILEKLVTYEFIMEHVLDRYDTTIPGKYDTKDLDSAYDYSDACNFPDGKIENCSLDEFFTSPMGEMIILKRKIYEMNFSIDYIYAHVYENDYDHAHELELKVEKYKKRLKELGY